MRTGLDEIDGHHRTLFARVNAVSDALTQGAAPARVAELLGFLWTYTLMHFAREEIEMERLRCPAAAENKEAHARFVAEIIRLRERSLRGEAGPGLSAEVQRKVSDWLLRHVCGVDTRMRDCIEGGEKA